MGDPRRFKSKYSRPGHPWQRERIEQERTLLREYGLKNKQEIYRATSRTKNFADLAKKLVASRGAQAEKERQKLLSRLSRMGLVKQGAQLDDVLGLDIKNLLDRRLQTLLVRKGLARSMKQSRQFITHAHITVGGRKVSAPGYHVLPEEEGTITFITASPYTSTSHPERNLPPKKQKPHETRKEHMRGRRRVRRR